MRRGPRARQDRVSRRIIGGGLGVAALLLAGQAAALTRIALVIGNSGYVNEPHLTNPARDARAMAGALKDVGFDKVTLVLDSNVADLNHALQAFQDQALAADIAVLYYAGHGMEAGGTNYLIPVDAKLASDRDLSFEAVPQGLAEQAAGGARLLSLVILDACRDNPFASTMAITSGAHRGMTRGLAPVNEDQLSVNSIVEYSAQSGTLASDGDPGAPNSPFAAALLHHVSEPGAEVTLLFGKVRDDVYAATHQSQRPASYGSHGGDPVYLVPPASPAPPHPLARAAVITAEEPRVSAELVDWQSVVVSSDPAAFTDYLARYPDAEYAPIARRRLNTLKAAAAAAGPTTPPPAPSGFGYGAAPSAAPTAPSSDATARDAEADYRQALAYLHGDGVAADPVKARELLTSAAKQDHVLAEFTLGQLCFSAGDYGGAWQMYQLAADQGYAPAQSALGYMNWAGLGMARNYVEALRWHRMAAAAGVASSIGDIGWFYATGNVVPQNLPLAVRWDQLAADRGDITAEANLGLLYFQGRGVNRDAAKARELMTQAARGNSPVALAWLKLNPPARN